VILTCVTYFCADIPPIDAFKWMGVVMIAVSCFGVGGQYFPMWGGMFFPAKKGVTEEDYYFAEYNAAEREKGYHLASSAFVSFRFPCLVLSFCHSVLPLCSPFCCVVVDNAECSSSQVRLSSNQGQCCQGSVVRRLA